jgi:hypothetical protein
MDEPSHTGALSFAAPEVANEWVFGPLNFMKTGAGARMWSGPPACNGGVHTAAPGGRNATVADRRSAPQGFSTLPPGFAQRLRSMAQSSRRAKGPKPRPHGDRTFLLPGSISHLAPASPTKLLGRRENYGTPGWIRTSDLVLRRQKISITYEHRRMKTKDLRVNAVDPIWTLKAIFRRVGPGPDPGFHVGNPHAFARTRAVASTSESRPKLICARQTGFQNSL